MALAPNLCCLPPSNLKQTIVPSTIQLQKVEPDPRSHKSTCHVCCAVSSTTQVPLSQPNHERRSANYQPTIWNYDFLQSLKNEQTDTLYKDKAEKLEQELRFAIHDEDAESLDLLEMIADIQRLGLEHRFETDIRKALEKFDNPKECGAAAETTLHAAALRFRLLRQHGYKVSQDVFKAFKDPKGNFMDFLSKDVKGMLSLYEASQLAFEGEDLMDEAFTFSRMHLKNLQGYQDKYLSEQVSHALELPLHRRMLMLEARWQIEAYSEKVGANPRLLELAKLDFNMVQSTLQEDLQDMSRWWMVMGLASKLNFARDRLMECFFWAVGMVSEPQFSNCRKGLTKVASFVTTIDDVYDVYGTLDELELFTDAVQRWDLSAVKNLPDYMKLCFLALYNSVNEMAYETLRDHGENVLPYLTKAWADLCKAFLQEARWSHNKYTPTFQEYLETAWVSVSGLLFLVHAYFLQRPDITSRALESLEKYDDLLRWPSLIFRLCNDLGTSKDELERGESANSITCYMKETGCSEAVARQHITDLIDKSWKQMNRAQMDASPFPKYFRETAINLARISQCTYQHGDAHGCPDSRSMNRVRSLIIEPIPIMDKAIS